MWHSFSHTRLYIYTAKKVETSVGGEFNLPNGQVRSEWDGGMVAQCGDNGRHIMGDTFWTTCFETTKQIQIQTVNIFVLKLPIGLSDMSILSPFITQSDLKIVER